MSKQNKAKDLYQRREKSLLAGGRFEVVIIIYTILEFPQMELF